ncbi:MAG TPA: hypothetical protein VIU34_12510 [Steroidobacter sp.]
MINFKKAMLEFIREEKGLTVVEYAIAGGLVGLGVVVAFTSLGGEVSRIILLIVQRLGLIQ